ncbi:TRAP transporter small permease [Pelagibacterium sp.]|uniref:TRAP transporter small permease n=1 Tax=Pelagibacterium sp. TaxID=1967288 RepID=UPI003A8F628F
MFQDQSPLGRCVYGLAKLMALVGGVVLIGLVLLVVVSVAGRALIWAGLRPVRGDYELVEAGIGFAVFAFLPWAHLERGHAIVTILTDRFGSAANRWILVVTDIMMLAAASFITWRLYDGMLDKFRYNETTLLLRMPLGWSYSAALVGAVIFVVVAIYVLGRSISNALARRSEGQLSGADL